MINTVPNWISILFLLIAVCELFFFYKFVFRNINVLLGIILWSILQLILAGQGFYHDTSSFPPRFGLVLIPSIVLIIIGCTSKVRKRLVNEKFNHRSIYLHSIRIPVEITLHQLFLFGMVPELMTFEGINFDIIIGISSIFVGFLFLRKKLSFKNLLVWNFIGLGFILFILINGILSAELPFQQFGFDQPNRAVEYFPFILLPSTVVPLVIYTHLVDIYSLLNAVKTR